MGLTNYSNHSGLISSKSRDERNCVGVTVLKVCVIKRLWILDG